MVQPPHYLQLTVLNNITINDIKNSNLKQDVEYSVSNTFYSAMNLNFDLLIRKFDAFIGPVKCRNAPMMYIWQKSNYRTTFVGIMLTTC